MKKVLALIIALVMILLMMPIMAISTSAVEVEGNWTTYRFSGGYKEPEEGEELSYTPAPGYEYNEEGFHMTSADYTGTTPAGTIQSKEKISLKDGVYMELRIDQYPYGGHPAPLTTGSASTLWTAKRLNQATPPTVMDRACRAWFVPPVTAVSALCKAL